MSLPPSDFGTLKIGITTLVAAAASCNIYFLREYCDGNLMWNDSEAYFFVEVGRQGHHVSCVRYPLFVVKEYLGGIESPDDDRAFLVVLRVTSSGVERHVLNLADRAIGGAGSDPTHFTPLEGHIYANCPELDGLCRWSGDHFERATQEERRRLAGPDRLAKDYIRVAANGWSKRHFGAGPPESTSTIDVGDRFRLSLKNLAVKGTEKTTVLIDVLRPGKTPERIGNFDARPPRGEMVSRTEYQRAFRDDE
jgi:hypothetical protein